VVDLQAPEDQRWDFEGLPAEEMRDTQVRHGARR
jgi:hypothetical protein